MGTYVVMQNLWLEGTRYQGLAHEETVEIHRSSPHSRLRKLENHARLEDKIDALATNRFLFIGRHSVDNGRGLVDLFVGKDPLLLGFHDRSGFDGRPGGGTLNRSDAGRTSRRSSSRHFRKYSERVGILLRSGIFRRNRP